jgi:hypothetical protein
MRVTVSPHRITLLSMLLAVHSVVDGVLLALGSGNSATEHRRAIAASARLRAHGVRVHPARSHLARRSGRGQVIVLHRETPGRDPATSSAG